MTQFKPKASASIEAIQWTGDNVTQIQDFMAPDSPLYNNRQSEPKILLGIYIWANGQYTTHELKFPKVGDWILRIPQGFRILSHEEFEANYEVPHYEPDTGQLVNP